MPDVGPSAVLPLRPLTVGELLDSAVLLLRGHFRVLTPVAAVLAAAEQALLYPLRAAAGLVPPDYQPAVDRFGALWILLAAGAATEAVIVALLGNPAARAAASRVLGSRVPDLRPLRPAGNRFGGTVLVALLVGVIMFVASLIMPAWMVGFALVGSAVPALVLDRVGPLAAVGRSAALAVRSTARAAGVRVLGQLAWLVLRLSLSLGVLAAFALGGVDPLGGPWTVVIAGAVWTGINCVAYSGLACLDAVIHVENRVRTEGLDILLSRARRYGPPVPDLLATGQ